MDKELMINLEQQLKDTIRDIKDFPKEGIIFKDITPILKNYKLCNDIIDTISEQFRGKVDVVAGIESRGFLFGMGIAQKLEIPFVPIRKKGKLPYDKISHKYELEYGYSEIEMHTDAVEKNTRVLIHDDLLATGGTAHAAAKLVKELDAEVSGFSFIINLTFLEGDKKLSEVCNKIHALVNY